MNVNELTAERRHDIRYHVQQYFIPEMVECVMDGYLPFIALFPSAQWLSNLRMDYEQEDLKAAKVWDSFEKIPVDEDTMIVLYTFPKPEDVLEAAYGAVLLNQATNEIKYLTLRSAMKTSGLCAAGIPRCIRAMDFGIRPTRIGLSSGCRSKLRKRSDILLDRM